MDLKSYLNDSGVRQQDFAKFVGKTQGYVSRVAAGTCKLGSEVVLEWAAATGFKVTPHDLRPDLYPNQRDGLPEQTAA
ncbi:YdaS family helix-turn-helix protein [Serratia fonticola]|jgi:DNA-binding transcriptional regulator YdaS (Cro superfamily)|uniref:YdaS family helix-turn-helix protein n=1 Tax=Serratia fonticola TaxID=47917 RepID=A0AAJ1YGB3_SERFO|nr:YdaS family helix-turn-helix protein [Serratia fonticola]MDQ9128762.1 YdaS family helix-turn-helix protein [Serratia fonticola]